MAAEPDDRWLERLLRRRGALAQDVQAPGVCLDAETLAAWADGTLTSRDLAAAQEHASTCGRCLALAATIERTAPVALRTGPRRAWLAWAVPLTAAATAVAIWVLVPNRVPSVTPEATTASSPSAPSPPPPAADTLARAEPAEPPVVPSTKMTQEAPSASPDLGGDAAASSRSREERSDARNQLSDLQQAESRESKLGAAAPERAAAEQNAAADAMAPAPPPAAAAPAAVGSVAESVTTMQRRAFEKPAIVESAAPGGINRWRVVNAVAVERSTDGGKTWARTAVPPGIQAVPPVRTIATIVAVDALSATVSTSDGAAYSTADGGVTWAPVQGKPAAPF